MIDKAEKKIPSSWKETTLGEVAEINGLTINKTYPYAEIEYIDVASVEERKFRITQKLRLSEAPSRAKRIVRDNDFLISTVRPNLKHYCFIKKSKPNLVASTGFAVISAKEADAYFLYNLLTTNDYTGYLTKIADTQTSTYPAFNPEVIFNSRILLPPVAEQRAIAKVILCLDDKIELLQSQNKTLENIAQALFKHWFIDFEFSNINGNPYKSSGGELIESELGEIPMVWRKGNLGEVLNFQYGKALKEKDRTGRGYPVLGSSGVVGYHDQFLVKGDGIVIGRKGTMGSVIWVEESFYPIDTTFYVEDNLGVNLLYYHYLLLLKQNFEKIGSDSAVPGLNRNSAYAIDVIIPKADIVNRFNMVVDPIFSKMKLNNLQIRTLSKIRDTVLPKLMKGEVRVAGF